MLIGIDASRANLNHKTGVEWYGAHVIRELAKLDHTNRYRLYSWEPLGGELKGLPGNFENVVLPARRLWSHTSLSTELKSSPVDRLFIPSHIVPRVHPAETTVTIHDIGFRHFRKNYTLYHYASLQVGTKLSARWAKHVVVPTETVRREVAEQYPATAQKLTVIPNGVDADRFRQTTPEEVTAVMARHRIRDPYLFFIGRLETRKNVPRLIAAFYRLKDSGLFGGQLVLAGNPGQGYEEIRELIAKRRNPDDIIQPGYVSEAERVALLTGARALVFPSLYEGFGIPILEAFATGTPVLTSDRGASAEVAGDGALLVNPYDVSAIHQGIERLLSDQTLAGKLVTAGSERVRHFSWQRTASELHAVLTA